MEKHLPAVTVAIGVVLVGLGAWAGVLLTFVVYALGMGAVVSALAMSVALARGSVVTRMRRATPWVERLGAVLLVAAGAYVTWYGWFEIRVLAGSATGDPVVDAATRVQSEISRFVSGLGVGVLALVVVVVVALALSSRRAAGRPSDPTAVEEAQRARSPARSPGRGRRRG